MQNSQGWRLALLIYQSIGIVYGGLGAHSCILSVTAAMQSWMARLPTRAASHAAVSSHNYCCAAHDVLRADQERSVHAGTSPLYVFPNIFSSEPSEEQVLGAMSLVFWTLTVVVIGKYLCLVLHANDCGEGRTTRRIYAPRDT